MLLFLAEISWDWLAIKKMSKLKYALEKCWTYRQAFIYFILFYPSLTNSQDTVPDKIKMEIYYWPCLCHSIEVDLTLFIKNSIGILFVIVSKGNFFSLFQTGWEKKIQLLVRWILKVLFAELVSIEFKIFIRL